MMVTTYPGLLLPLFLVGLISDVEGHGRLWTPPSRSTMWRQGFHTPVNYDDIELYCGGMTHQWEVNHGKCGICGDPYDGARENEAGGKYATGTISRYYRKNQVITVDVDLTTNHLGWFEFRLCPNNNVKKPATQQCLDKYLLQTADGSGSRIKIGHKRGHILTKLKLPAGLTCSQCVLQWKYHTGNTWGSGNKCVGMGCADAQEEFYGCADVAILDDGVPIPSTMNPKTFKPRLTTRKSGRYTTPHAKNFKKCHAIGAFVGIYDKWCKDFCPKGNCPSNMCQCE